MTDLLFDPPWYLIIGLALAGLVLLYTGLTKPAAGLKWTGAGLLTAAVAVYLLGRFFETGQERVFRETKEVVAAADRRDWKAFAALLDPKVRFAPWYANRDQLVSGATKTMDVVDVRNVTIGNLEAKAEPGGYTVTFVATADIKEMPGRAPTNWAFSWLKDRNGENYLLANITPLKNEQFGTEPVITRLAKP